MLYRMNCSVNKGTVVRLGVRLRRRLRAALLRRERRAPQSHCRSLTPNLATVPVVFGPADTTLATLARVAGRRWAIEECFEVAKQEVGLADYEIRSRHGWYR